MKKILISLGMIGVVAAIAIGGTMALFTDTETSTDNTFTAGTLNLTLNDMDGDDVVKFTVPNTFPGDSGNGTWTLVNAGSLTGHIDLESILVTNAENYDAATDEAEAADDTDTSDNTGGGELGANLNVDLFWDDGTGMGGVANNGVQDGEEVTIYSGLLDGIATSYSEDYSLAGGATTYISMTWSIDTAVNNTIQGDSATLEMTIELAQTTGQ